MASIINQVSCRVLFPDPACLSYPISVQESCKRLLNGLLCLVNVIKSQALWSMHHWAIIAFLSAFLA